LFCWNIAFITLPSQAMNLKIEIEQEEDGRFIAEGINIIGVLAYVSTRQEAVANEPTPKYSKINYINTIAIPK
jgi:hypothetical protein